MHSMCEALDLVSEGEKQGRKKDELGLVGRICMSIQGYSTKHAKNEWAHVMCNLLEESAPAGIVITIAAFVDRRKNFICSIVVV